MSVKIRGARGEQGGFEEDKWRIREKEWYLAGREIYALLGFICPAIPDSTRCSFGSRVMIGIDKAA